MKNNNKKNKVIISIGVMLTTILIAITGFFTYAMNQVNHVEIDKSDESLGITKKSTYASVSNQEQTLKFDSVKENNEIINVALFGLDRRDKNEISRADATMILTIDFAHNKIKLSSLMRDMYIDIEGYNKTKFNHAYSYGGAPLAIKTINQNFGTDIQDYVAVDFFMLEKVIDEIGGVTIDVEENEYPLMNKYMAEVAKISNEDFEPLVEAGHQILDGKQAVAYARIRKVGNGDFERTERQRLILTEIVSTVSTMDKVRLTSLVINVLPFIETSLDANTILNLAVSYLSKGINTVEQDRFPRDGYWEGTTIDKAWYMSFDLESTKNQIQEFIYEEDDSINESSIKLTETELLEKENTVY